MYVLPGYVTFKIKDQSIYVSSSLLQNTVKLKEPSICQEFLAIVDRQGCMSLSTPLTVFLHDQELLLTVDEIKGTLSKVRDGMNQCLFLTIMPTENCNFRCPYCYESHSGNPMTRKMIDCIKDYIEANISKFKTLQISWFGGEPTLCKNVVLEISNFACSLQRNYQFYYDSNMTTNGFLLDVQSFIQYYCAGIRTFQVTIDGRNHDRTRPHVSGIPTLNVILDNLKNIAALSPEEYFFKIIIRHNILADDTDYSWYDYLYTIFGSDKRFLISAALVTDWGGDEIHTLHLAEGTYRNDLKVKHQNYIKKIGLNLLESSNTLFSNICYASFPYGFVFRPNGQIEKCTICLGSSKNVVGRIDSSDGIIIDSGISAQWSTNEIQTKCCTCKNVLSCLNVSCKKGEIIDGMQSNCVCEIYHEKKT